MYHIIKKQYLINSCMEILYTRLELWCEKIEIIQNKNDVCQEIEYYPYVIQYLILCSLHMHYWYGKWNWKLTYLRIQNQNIDATFLVLPLNWNWKYISQWEASGLQDSQWGLRINIKKKWIMFMKISNALYWNKRNLFLLLIPTDSCIMI